MKDGMFETIIWEDVVVGDILKVIGDEEFPVDMVFLCSSDSQGVYNLFTLQNRLYGSHDSQKLDQVLEQNFCKDQMVIVLLV